MSTSTLSTATGTFRIDLQGPADAPVVVLSNSLGTTFEMWDGLAKALSGSFRVLRYDTRGHGESVCTPGPYSFSLLGQDVLSILDALHIEKAHFCGISMGGLTGLWLGVNAAARLHSITVANSAAKIGTASAWQERATMVRSQGVAGMQTLASSAPSRWFTETFCHTHPELVKTAQSWVAGISPEGYASCCEALAQEDLRSKLHTIATPTLLIAGEFDPVTTVADAQAMQSAIPHASLVQLPASHLSNLEAPETFAQALTSFIHRG
ncbi:MAG TPA: 3-oxoadipate enol-lactonase [Comamonas sp.]